MQNTSQRLLDVAEALTQTRGFNAFSFADLSESVGVSKPTVHHHFKTKSEMGRQLIDRYNSRFFDACHEIADRNTSARAMLIEYAALYEGVLKTDKMCLCGMLASEYFSLPEEMQASIRVFIRGNEQWLTSTIGIGVARREIVSDTSTQVLAASIMATLEGAMLLSRLRSDVDGFRAISKRLISDICNGPRSRL
jgi:TetR/AcrR family transcriptional regulator, transcriptional repressor for nem operon